MSKNRNRKRLSRAKSNREYNILLKGFTGCYICCRRCGLFNIDCGYPYRERNYVRNWKHFRKYQWKEKK